MEVNEPQSILGRPWGNWQGSLLIVLDPYHVAVTRDFDFCVIFKGFDCLLLTILQIGNFFVTI